jgi:hypothetical protein
MNPGAVVGTGLEHDGALRVPSTKSTLGEIGAEVAETVEKPVAVRPRLLRLEGPLRSGKGETLSGTRPRVRPRGEGTSGLNVGMLARGMSGKIITRGLI